MYVHKGHVCTQIDRQEKQGDRQVPGESVNDDGWNMVCGRKANVHMEIYTSVLVLRTVTTEHQQSSVTTGGGRFFSLGHAQ